ncbi:pyruvate, water dikinase regulatory protein [Magnetovibrio sp. PR-2]|uniref:pyruvate, water dikinase regulatory protein n=1 Tax=Magnetovibrio sp. PR-2 TaxID=3120356 RepID=UPI002FCE50CE
MTTLILHKISDSTGETLDVVARACLVQFPDMEVVEKRWTMVRTAAQLDEILQDIQANPGFVIFTLVDDDLSEKISLGCKKLKVPCIDLLNPVLGQMANYIGVARESRPGSQHVMDADYFSKIAALHFVLAHDDGQSMNDIEDADVILVGVSRTTKTPTCIYLANRGIKAANVPIVPGVPLAPEVLNAEKPLVVGISKDPRRLVQIRKQRLKMQGMTEETDYIDPDAVAEEIRQARKLYGDQKWPMIDVTRKSVEETAATILNLYNDRIDMAS